MTQNLLNVQYICGLMLGAGVFVAGALAVSGWGPENQAILFSPPAIDEREKVFWDGDIVEREFLLSNHSAMPFTIERVISSCECTKLAMGDSRSFPFVVHPKQVVSILTRTVASGEFGQQRVQLLAEGRTGALKSSVGALLVLRVRPKVVSDPKFVAAGQLTTGQLATKTVDLWLAPGAEDPGIESVSSTQPDAIHLVMQCDSTHAARDDGYLRLGRVEVDIDSCMLSEKFSERIIVRFRDDQSISIPLYGWVNRVEAQ